MASPERNRDNGLRKTFGISHKQYLELAEAQGNVCFICQGRDNFSEHLAVDHCHTNGHVRGLLCRNCNRALGQFQDNVDYLERAIVYLKKDPPVIGEPEPVAAHKPQEQRKRYYCRVTTPEGVFPSYKDAGEHYKVHPTTVREWCVGTKVKRAGFSAEKVFGGKHD